MAERALVSKSSETKWEVPASRIHKARNIRSIKSSVLQAKLRIGQPNDIYEQEADRVAEQIMRMPDPTLQRRCSKCNDDEKGILQTKKSPGQPLLTQGQDVPPIVHDVLRSPGQPLDSATRAFMEPRFGYDFSGVRVHTDAKAAESAKAMSARAFTVGRNVVFGAGEYTSKAEEGNKLLAHELMHILQQRQADDSLLQKKKQRKIAIEAIKYPNLVLYQNHAEHGTFFHSVGNRISRRIGGLDLSSDECPEHVKFGPMAFDTGDDIINTIEKAHLCTGKSVTQVHIVSHSGPGGIYGTGSFLDQYGLYREDNLFFSQADRDKGGRMLSDLPVEALAPNVVFVMHGCSTAYGDDSFAEALLKRIIGTSPKARVYGHVESGEAGRRTDWKEFSGKAPEGKRRSINPYHPQ